MKVKNPNNNIQFLSGGGEMGKLTREKDWSKTSLGATISWPQSLRTTLSIILNSKFPMFLFWGEELICFYNDAYRPSLGKVGKHPSILGGKGEEAWVEIWHIIKPIIDTVLAGEEASLYEDQLVPIYRNGKIEDVYWTFSYSPVNNGTGKPAGVFVACTETTEKITILNKVKESEKRFHEMVAQAPVAICVLRGLDYIVEVANEKMLEIWGRTAEQMLNKPVFEAMPDAADQGLEKLLNEVYKTGKPFIANELPVNLIRNGVPELVFLNFVYEPLYGYDKTISSIVAVATEVTEQINARNKIEQSEQILHNFFMHTPALMHILRGPEHIFGLANSEYQKFIGNRNPTGKKLLEAMPELAEQNFINILDNVYKTGESFSGNEMPVFLTMENGQLAERYVNVNYIPFDNAQEQRDILAFAYDVTEQINARKKIEQSEKELQRLFEQAPAAIVILTGPQHVFTLVNPHYEIMVGRTKEQLLGKSFREAFPEVEGQGIYEMYDNLFQKGEGIRHTALPVTQNKAGKLVNAFYDLSVEPIKDTDGKTNSLLFIGYDITEQTENTKKIEESEKQLRELSTSLEQKVTARTAELNRKNIELENANKELQSFAYISSHDLQEPLRKIQTFASRIREKEENNLSEYGRENFKKMQNAANRMQTLIQDLLAYSRTTTSERKFENTDLNKIINEVKEDLDEDLKEKHATIETTDLCYACIIPFQFRQLMLNLISNALKFSKSETASYIKITSVIANGKKLNNEKLMPQKKYCHITVSDNGIGFEQQYSERIFEVFQCLHGKNEYNGTGIGLSIVKKIIENHEGIITASSELNKGATFNIYIPA